MIDTELILLPICDYSYIVIYFVVVHTSKIAYARHFPLRVESCSDRQDTIMNGAHCNWFNLI